MPADTIIPCIRCGLCCRKAVAIPGFPEAVREDGSCIHLQVDNRCGIYESRPDICDSRTMYERHFSNLSPGEFAAMNAAVCKTLLEEAGWDTAPLMNALLRYNP